MAAPSAQQKAAPEGGGGSLKRNLIETCSGRFEKRGGAGLNGGSASGWRGERARETG